MSSYNTPYDDAYKTMMEKFPQLLIPLINEEFQKDYGMDEKIENLNQESHKEDGTIVADSVIRIGNTLYHAECQSNPDRTIAVRILEYDFYIAMKEMAVNEEGLYEITFPKSCVIYLKCNQNTPDAMTVRVKVSDETAFDYSIPIIKSQKYTLNEIFEKKLFLLLPFYIMRYEKDAERISENPEKLDRIISEYQEIVERMERAFQSNSSKEGKRLSAELQKIMKRIAEYLFRKNENAKKKIGGAIMGGTAWKTFTEELREKDTKLKEKDTKLKEKDTELQEKDIELKEKDTELREKDTELKVIKAKLKGMPEEDIAAQEGISIERVKEILQ